MSRSFYLLWCSSLISQVGDWLYLITLPLEIYRLTGSAFHMASIYGVEFLPWVLFSMFGGLLADKVNKKRLLLLGNLLSGLLVVILSYAMLGEGKVNLTLIYVLVFCLASINPLIHPAFQSIIPSLVAPTHLVKANSANQLIESSLSFLGPLIGGSLLTVISGRSALLIDALSFMAAAALISFIRLKGKPAMAQNGEAQAGSVRKVAGQLYAGLQYVGRNKVILYGSLLFFFTNFAINAFQSNYMYYLTEILGLTPALMGLTIGLQGIGPIIGAFAAPYLGRKIPAGKLILFCTASAGVATLLLLRAQAYWQVALVQAFVMACGNVNVVTYFSLRQKIVPPALLGRVVSVTRMISYTSIPISAFLAGLALSHGFSIFAIILVAGALRLGAGLAGLMTPLATDGNTFAPAKASTELPAN